MNVICPRCLCSSAITLDVTDGDSLHCPECDEDYTLTDVVELVESWGKVLPWLMAHPARVEAAVS